LKSSISFERKRKPQEKECSDREETREKTGLRLDNTSPGGWPAGPRRTTEPRKRVGTTTRKEGAKGKRRSKPKKKQKKKGVAQKNRRKNRATKQQ